MSRDHDDGDRPKKSWREIDQAREKGRSEAAPKGQNPERQARSQAYRSYKTQLNKLFSGGAMPDALKGKMSAAGVAPPTQNPVEVAAKAIMGATTPKEITQAVQAYMDVHGFPNDEEVLARILDHNNEAWALRAIEALSVRQAEGSLQRIASLKARLKTVQLTFDDPEIRGAAAKLLATLR